jgi:hypothetical protein
MKFKKKVVGLAVASALSMSVLPMTSHAQSADFEGNEFFIDELLDSSLDLDDATFRVISSAINIGSVDGSINLQAQDITFNKASAASASSTSSALTSEIEGATANALSQSSATSGNFFRTTAVGAANNTDVTVESLFGYTRDSSAEVVGTGLPDNDIEDVLGGAALSIFATGLGGYEIASDGPPQIAVFQSALNTGDINASVNITSGALAQVTGPFGFSATFGGFSDLVISDLAISTTAIGATNSGSLKVGSDFQVNVTTSPSITLDSSYDFEP